MTRSSIIFLSLVAALTITLNAAKADDYYYSLDSAISISESGRYVAIQFDSNRVVPEFGTFQST